ncbi:MAG TPA: hypothetical protein VI520_00515 [Anaerolineales bacterium]|nr:hypothetical protein [Anaerolineales bacterium]
MHKWLVFLHVLGAMGFMLAHGGTTAMTLLLKRQRGLDAMRALLDLSRHSGPAMGIALLVLLGGGIAAGFTGRWWGEAWIWISLAILIGITAVMAWSSRAQYHKLRKVLGMPYFDGRREQPAPPPAAEAEIYAVQATLRPGLLSVVSFGGIVLIAWLMMYKPF